MKKANPLAGGNAGQPTLLQFSIYATKPQFATFVVNNPQKSHEVRDSAIFDTISSRNLLGCEAQVRPRSAAVRSKQRLASATISSISARVMVSGGEQTMVSRIARMTRPSRKQ